MAFTTCTMWSSSRNVDNLLDDAHQNMLLQTELENLKDSIMNPWNGHVNDVLHCAILNPLPMNKDNNNFFHDAL